MRWKKIAIGLATTILIAVPSAILIYLAAKPHPPQPTTKFLMNFKNELSAKDSNLSAAQRTTYAADQAYINKIEANVRDVLAAYKAENPGFSQLNLHFISLNSALTPGQINYFNELNKTFLAISPMLGFTLQQPNPITLQEGYYQMNTDMVSFYWGPNYNGLGTWLAYMFSNGYALANLWHPVAQLLQDYLNNNYVTLGTPVSKGALSSPTLATATSPNPSWYNGEDGQVSAPDPAGNGAGENWVLSLANSMYNTPMTFQNENTGKNYEYPIIKQVGTRVNPANGKTYPAYQVASPSLIIQIAQSNDADSNDAYTAIDTAVGSWVSRHNDTGGRLSLQSSIGLPGYSPWIQPSFTGGIDGYKPSMSTQLVNFMCSYLPNMPYIQNGHNTIVNQLVRFGDHAIINSETNFRDWYYDPQENPNGATFTWWNSNNPFTGQITQYNSCFSQSSAGPLIGSTFDTLFSYANIGDYYNPKYTPQYEADNYHLVLDSQATPVTPTEVENALNSDFNEKVDPQLNIVGATQPTYLYGKNKEGTYINFPIIPIPWVNGKGQPSGHYLSPADFLAGFKAYMVSVQDGINSNGYFPNLASINMSATLNCPENQAVNTADTDKPFRIYFNKPALSGSDIVGILANQYFSALPSFDPLVQNIINPKLYNKIAVMSNGVLNTTNTNMSEFYGCGPYNSTWQDLYYASPYIISEVNSQQMVATYNPYFFDAHSKTYVPPGQSSVPAWASSDKTAWNADPADYVTFMPNPADPNAPAAHLQNGVNGGQGQPIRKFQTIKMNYAGGYQEQITYEMFGKGTLDMSAIPESLLNQAFQDYPKDIYQPLNEEIDQSNLVPYNTNVYTTNADGNIALFSANGQPAPAAAYQHVGEDNFGNFFWPHYITQNGNTTWLNYQQYMADKAAYAAGKFPAFSQIQSYQPHIKSNVSSAYNNLIVKNFYTPYRPVPSGLTPAQRNKFLLSESSIIIRSAINDLINWYSLCSVAFPFQSLVMQNSFMPYGVFNTNPSAKDEDASNPSNSQIEIYQNDPRWRYWSIAAYKVGQQAVPLGERQGGIVQWTWTQYINEWKQIFQISSNTSGNSSGSSTTSGAGQASAQVQIVTPTGSKNVTQLQAEE